MSLHNVPRKIVFCDIVNYKDIRLYSVTLPLSSFFLNNIDGGKKVSIPFNNV